jgi:hypothetical protein
MLCSKYFKNNKGQSLTETALIAPLIVFFLFTIIWFAQIMLTWQQIAGAARYGTDLIAYTPFSKNYIKQDIINYLCDKKTVGRILNKDKLEVTVEIRDAKKIDFSLSLSNLLEFNPLKVIENITSLNPINEEKSYVEIVYFFDIPFVLKIFGKDNISIKARSEVLSGSASAGEKERD